MLTGPGTSLILKDLVKIAHNFFLASSSPQVSLNLILLKNFKNLRSLTQYSCKIKEQLRRKKSQYLFCLTTPFLDFTLSSKFDIKGLSNLVEDNSLKRKRALQPEYVLSIWYSQYLLPSQHCNLQEAYSKVVFWEAMVLVLHIYSYFYWRIKYSKFINGDVYGTSMEPSCHTGSKSWDILGPSAGRQLNKFLKQLSNTLNLLWQLSQDLIVTV